MEDGLLGAVGLLVQNLVEVEPGIIHDRVTILVAKMVEITARVAVRITPPAIHRDVQLMEVGHHGEVMDLVLKIVELAINIATDTAIVHHQLMAGRLVRVVL